MSALSAAKSTGDETTAACEVLPRPTAHGEVMSAWLSSLSSPPPVSDVTGEARGDGGREAASVRRGGSDASLFGTAGRAGEMHPGLRLRLPVLPRRLLLAGDGGVTAVPAAAVVASSMTGERSPEGRGAVAAPLTFVVEEAGCCAAFDSNGTRCWGGEGGRF